MSNTQEQMLIKVYQAMPSVDIEQRLAGGELIPLARGVAENELQQRRARGDMAGAGTATLRTRITRITRHGPGAEKFTANPMMSLAVVVSLCMITWVLLLVLPPWGLLFGVGVAFFFSTTVAQAFPTFGVALGLLLVGSRVWVTVDYWTKPGKGGLEGMLIFFGISLAALVLLCMGWSCIQAARGIRARSD